MAAKKTVTTEKKVVRKERLVKKPTKKEAMMHAGIDIPVVTEKKSIKNKLEVEVFDMAGKIVEHIILPTEIFGAKINPVLMSQAVRVYLANQRKGSASTKTRGEVAGSTRKIYRQKGTGRARHGGVRAPIFVHGGIAHGPKFADHSLAFPKKMKRVALLSALSAKVNDNEVKVIQGLESIEIKTKTVAGALKGMNMFGSVLVVMPKHLENVLKASRNIAGVQVTSVDRLNTYEVLEHKTIVLMKDTVKAFENVFRKEKAHGSE